jgi:hypothetical protein
VIEERRYLTDDRDMEEHPMELRLFMGENGDWYMSVLPQGDRYTKHCVRITTSGSRYPGMSAALAALHRAMVRT